MIKAFRLVAHRESTFEATGSSASQAQSRRDFSSAEKRPYNSTGDERGNEYWGYFLLVGLLPVIGLFIGIGILCSEPIESQKRKGAKGGLCLQICLLIILGITVPIVMFALLAKGIGEK